MLGTEDDWNKLTSKLKVLRSLLEPVENDLGLQLEWWDLVEKVFWKLIETYQERPEWVENGGEWRRMVESHCGLQKIVWLR